MSHGPSSKARAITELALVNEKDWLEKEAKRLKDHGRGVEAERLEQDANFITASVIPVVSEQLTVGFDLPLSPRGWIDFGAAHRAQLPPAAPDGDISPAPGSLWFEWHGAGLPVPVKVAASRGPALVPA